MNQLTKITNEEFHKIFGAREHPQTNTVEVTVPMLTNIDDILSMKNMDDKKIKDYAEWNSPKGTNTYIAGEDQNKDQKPYFNKKFGAHLAHTEKHKITYVTIVPGAYCKLDLNKPVIKKVRENLNHEAKGWKKYWKTGLTTIVASALLIASPLLVSGKIKSPSLESTYRLLNITEARIYNLEKQESPIKRVYVDEKPFGSLDYVETFYKDKNRQSNPFQISKPSQEDIEYFEKEILRE